MGCVYRHPSMELSEFDNYYLSNLLETLSNENKTVALLGDFNSNLIFMTKIVTFLIFWI